MVSKVSLVFVCCIVVCSLHVRKVSGKLENCRDDLPFKVKVNLPDTLRQNVRKPFHLKLFGSLREDIEGPFTLSVDIRKEWFAGFWTVIPCFNMNLKNCKLQVTPKMIRKAGYTYPLKRGIFKITKELDLQKVPKMYLKGRYKITIIVSAKHGKRIACLSGDLRIAVRR